MKEIKDKKNSQKKQLHIPLSLLFVLLTPPAVYVFIRLGKQMGFAVLFRQYEGILWFCAIILLAGIVTFFLEIIGKLRIYRVYRTIHQIDQMSGEDFELLCRNYFISKHWKVKMTKRTGDYGADLILTKKRKGVKERIVVQCKRYTGKVGQSAIREACAAISFYNADRAMCITNSFYTPAAKALADSNGIELWDRLDCEKIFSPKSLLKQ